MNKEFIDFTQKEIEIAKEIARVRVCHNHNLNDPKRQIQYKNHITGALGEIAVMNYLKIEINKNPMLFLTKNKSITNRNLSDILNVEVRATTHRNPSLPLYRKDLRYKGDRPYVLVQISEDQKTYKIIGFQTPSYGCTLKNKFTGTSKMYDFLVPKEDLIEIEYLTCFIKE